MGAAIIHYGQIVFYIGVMLAAAFFVLWLIAVVFLDFE